MFMTIFRNTPNLARSTIIKILSDLKKGQYIVVEKGKLINISSLPERY
ncbi:putative DNA-binding transcriptional regulator [Leclercia adecarboxylata]|uniref:Putative DNA-binding transcriptional regulator n=1 Tax=Leclercia adecarboxylata TaxID=83655 RepID=A0A4U9HR19_9ENTR|nr:putative DNA-binding transcriptional regulator [Leclercia adecarboxylata]